MTTAPEFRPPATLEVWKKQREEIRSKLWQLLKISPPFPAPIVRTVRSENRPGYRFERIEFSNGRDTVPGYLLIPEQVKPNANAPAVLYCHWHGGEYAIGKEELFHKNHFPEVPAEVLVKMGCVVLAIDAYCFGERSGKGPGGAAEKGGQEELSASKLALWEGRNLWGMMVRDDLLAFEYLSSRPEVDPANIAVMGMSMGATRSWWLMALEPRIRTGVAVACLTRYQDLIRSEALRAHGIYYYVPGILQHFDMEAVIALIAPRPVLFLNGDDDSGSPVEGIRQIGQRVAPVYKLFQAEKNLQNRIFPGVKHDCTPEMWDQLKVWLTRFSQKTSPV